MAEALVFCTCFCTCFCCSCSHCCCLACSPEDEWCLSCRKVYCWSVVASNKHKFPYIYAEIKNSNYFWMDVFVLYMKRTLYLSMWIIIYMFIVMTPLLLLRIKVKNIESTTPAPTSAYAIITYETDIIFGLSLLISTVSTICWFVIIWVVGFNIRLLINFVTLYMKMTYTLLFKEQDTYPVLCIVHVVYYVTLLVWIISYLVDLFGIFSSFDEFINLGFYGDEINAVIDTHTKRITNDKYLVYWIYSLVLSPLLILVLSLIKLKCCNCKKISSTQSLLPDNANDKDEQIQHINENKTLINTILITHSILLLLWIFWQLFTFQTLTLSFNFSDDIEVDSDIKAGRLARLTSTALESFVILYSTTTCIKLLCNNLLISKCIKNTETAVRLKLGIHLFVSMLYNLGLKFVFSNVKEWDTFLIISGLNCVGHIAFYGAFLSHKRGKKVIIKLKTIINSVSQILICKRLCHIYDISDRNYWDGFDHELALKLGSEFIISVYSYFIMLVYLLMYSLTLRLNINGDVYIFLSIDFMLGIVMFMGDVYCFEGKHVKWFAEIWYLSLNTEKKCKKKNNANEETEIELEIKSNISSKISSDTYSSVEINVQNIDFDIGEIIFYEMMLAWVWIGTLTGIPYDLKA
eukprot:340527_1